MRILTTASALALVLLSEYSTVESFSTTTTTRSNAAVAPSRLFSTVGEDQQQQQKGGPPPSVQGGPPPQGGPPQGGPPQGGPPGGPPQGGPPPQTPAQKLLEQGLDVAFNFLYAGDEIGLQDSSKNLRVLWTRSILNKLGKIEDPIAFELLPKKTRWVANVAADLLPESVLEKLDWIVKRTDFIDGQLNSFLESTKDKPSKQVLVLGSGYDTRCLRYGNLAGIDFYCVDLPSVTSNCGKIVERYQQDVDDLLGAAAIPNTPTFVSLDLNSVGTGEGKVSILDTLSKQGFVLDGSIPTMVLCEAVLFYLSPPSAQCITSELFSLTNSQYCLTDNLSKVGVIPGGGPEGPPPIAAKARCEKWLSSQNKDLVDHDSIWGGAIHFVGARETSE